MIVISAHFILNRYKSKCIYEDVISKCIYQVYHFVLFLKLIYYQNVKTNEYSSLNHGIEFIYDDVLSWHNFSDGNFGSLPGISSQNHQLLPKP